MNKVFNNILMLVLLLFAAFTGTACSDENDTQQKDYPAPLISEFYPSEGLPGSIVTIKGANFGSERTERIGRVYFGGSEATEYAAWSDTEIQVRVPSKGVSGKISLWIWKNNTETTSEFTCIPGAEITKVEPEVAFPGSTITFHGKNFQYFIDKGLALADIVVEFTAENGTTQGTAKEMTANTLSVEIPTDAKGGATSVTFGNYQKIAGPNLTLIGDIKFTFLDYVAKDGSVSVSESAIDNTKTNAYVIYKFTAPATGLFDAYVLAGTTKSGSYLNVDMGTDLENLKVKSLNNNLTVPFINSNNWNAKDKHNFGPFVLREGNEYYLKLTFLQDGTTWVGNVHEMGMTLSSDQSQSGGIVVDNDKPLGYVIYQNDFNSGKILAPFREGWAESPNYIRVENQYCEFYYNQAALDANPDRRMLKGAELTCDFKTNTEGWYGFKFYLPEGKFPKNTTTHIAQIFQQGDKNVWAGLINVEQEILEVEARYVNYVGESVHTKICDLQWDKWYSVVVHFKVSRKGTGMIQVWIDDDPKASPRCNIQNINFGFGDWIDDETLNGEVTDANPLADNIGCKFGMYCNWGGDRTIRFDDLKALEGNPAGAFEIVKPGK